MNFYTFDEMVETLQRGNEIEFEYKNIHYSLFPNWINDSIKGFYIGERYKNNFKLVDCESIKKYKISGEKFIDIFPQINIVDRII